MGVDRRRMPRDDEVTSRDGSPSSRNPGIPREASRSSPGGAEASRHFDDYWSEYEHFRVDDDEDEDRPPPEEEQDADWLREVGLDFVLRDEGGESGAQTCPDLLRVPYLRTLSREQAAAVQKRLDTVTLRRKKHPPKLDVREVFGRPSWIQLETFRSMSNHPAQLQAVTLKDPNYAPDLATPGLLPHDKVRRLWSASPWQRSVFLIEERANTASDARSSLKPAMGDAIFRRSSASMNAATLAKRGRVIVEDNAESGK
ncbi:hypothetical protein ISCGN_012951 [Ixodes scapularis]